MRIQIVKALLSKQIKFNIEITKSNLKKKNSNEKNKLELDSKSL